MKETISRVSLSVVLSPSLPLFILHNMSSIAVEEEHFIDHEGRRAMAVIVTQSPPVAHNAPPVTFSFYIRSGFPYFNSTVHFTAVRVFCHEMARYLELSGFFGQTTARIVRLEIYDARDRPQYVLLSGFDIVVAGV